MLILKKVRFYVALILAGVFMLSASYIFHGLILNDFSKLNLNFIQFILKFTLPYLMLSFMMSLALAQYRFLHDKFSRRVILSFLFGVVVFGLNYLFLPFYIKSSDNKMILIDLIWQCLEQGIGGCVIAFVYQFSERVELFESDH